MAVIKAGYELKIVQYCRGRDIEGGMQKELDQEWDIRQINQHYEPDTKNLFTTVYYARRKKEPSLTADDVIPQVS